MPNEIRSPVKLAVRDRGEWVVAYLCPNEPDAENSPDSMEVGRISKFVVSRDVEAFEDWVRVLTAWQVRWVQSTTGLTVDRVDTIRKMRPTEN